MREKPVIDSSDVSAATRRIDKVSTAVVQAPALTSKGGAERLALTVAACLRDRGFQVIVASPDSKRVDFAMLGAYFDLDLENLRHVPTARSTWPYRFMRPSLANLLRQMAILVRLRRLRASLHVNAVYKSDLGSVAPKSIYYVHFPHHLVGQGTPRVDQGWAKIHSRLSKRLLSAGRPHPSTYDLVLANSEFTAGQIRSRWGAEASVIEPPCPAHSPANTSRLRQILVVGRFQDPGPQVPHKKQDVLIKAFSQMPDLHSSGWTLHLAGSSGSEAELERLRSLASGFPVVFHPDVSYSDLTELYSTSSIYWHAQGYGEDISAYPETQEHFGITVVEAMSAGLLPVVYGSAGPQEIVSPLGEGLQWDTLDELAVRTRVLISLTAEKETELRGLATSRARDFDQASFLRRLNSALASLEEQN